jgi:hypothetical protein
MAQFRPGCFLPNPKYTGNSWSKETRIIWKSFKTYRELLKKLPELIEQNIDPEGLYVLRTRRGEWGEWFERWELINGKPKIIKQGWN